MSDAVHVVLPGHPFVSKCQTASLVPARTDWKKGSGPKSAKPPVGKKGSGPKSAKHPKGRSGSWDLTPFSQPRGACEALLALETSGPDPRRQAVRKFADCADLVKCGAPVVDQLGVREVPSHATIRCVSAVLAGPARALGHLESLQAAPPPSVMPAELKPDVETGLGWEKGDFRIVPYGSFWANMIYATQRTSPGAFTLFVFSEESHPEDAFHTDARRSRFGLDVFGPEIPIRGGLSSGGRVEVDFLGEYVTENQAQARIRHVYLELYDENQRILIGQTWDVISPLYPRTVNFSVGWFGGNIGFRRAQFRYERFGTVSEDVSWVLQTSLNQDITPDFPTDPGVVRESGNYPVIEARTALSFNPLDAEKPITLGISAHLGETGFDFLTTGPPPLLLPPEQGARFETWSYNLDLAMPLGPRAHLLAEFFHGRNLSPFLGGVGQGVCPCNRAAITSIGGWADLQYSWTENLTTDVGYGVDDPFNDEFLVGRTYNQFLFANLVVHVSKALSTGLEVTYWKTLYQDQRAGLIPPDQLRPSAPGKSVTVDWMVRYDF